MNFQETLLEAYSLGHVDRIVSSIKNDVSLFEAFFHFFLHGDMPLRQRASWPAGRLSDEMPELFEPYIDEIIACLNEKDVHSSIIRNALKILYNLPLNEVQRGIVVNHCFDFIESAKVKPAVHALAIHIIAKECKGDEEIMEALRLILEEVYEIRSKAFQSAARKVINR